MTREEATNLARLSLHVSPLCASEWVDVWVRLGMLKLDEDIPPGKAAMCKAFCNYESTYRHREARSRMPAREAWLILNELEKLGFKVVKA